MPFLRNIFKVMAFVFFTMLVSSDFTAAFRPLSEASMQKIFYPSPSRNVLDDQRISQKYKSITRSRVFALGLSASTAEPLDAAISNSTNDDSANSSTNNATSKKHPSPKSKESKYSSLDMPWSDVQEWTLRDKIGQFTITVPVNVDGKETMRSYTLWRSFSEETIELAGYPLSFLVKRYMDMYEDESNEMILRTSPEILPFLDEFVFEATGGMSGRIYGITGVADGTRIQTTPVTDVQATIPKRFVRTADGDVIYELGKPAAELSFSGSSLEGGKQMAERAAASLKADGLSTAEQARNSEEPFIDSDLVNIAGFTGVVLAGAYAVESLSHHLTVNMFWV